MALTDLYQIVAQGDFSGQQWNCVFYYDQRLAFVTTDPTVAQTVAERFYAQVVPTLLNCMVADVVLDRLIVTNLFNDADGYTFVVGETGTGGTGNDYVSTFQAYPFELVGESMVTRRGAKRVPGVIEEVITDGVVTDVPFIGNMQDFADAIQEDLMVGAIIPDPVFSPVIVKRVREGVPGAYTYRLPETLLEKVVNKVVDVLIDLVVGHQISREIGVGS